ncbi:MAG: RNA-binding protein [Eubacteriaceae bacterium]|jgi:predicted RNA-binding protein (virulence factor B family)|nr:RNA-binding protein [Eubacteriaceae bacterium]
MIKLGKIQELEIDRITPHGAYLKPVGSADGSEAVLLPQKECHRLEKVGSVLEVFIYKDSEDRLIATKRKARITLGEIAVLRVVEMTKIGAFLDWGLEKDLFLPFSEQAGRVYKGKKYPVYLYLDKSNRLCATMKLYEHLESQSPYQVGDKVEGVVYQINKKIGTFVAVDHRYHGLILQQDDPRAQIGETIEAEVSQIRYDGKLTLSYKRQAYKQINPDAKKIYEMLVDHGGALPYGDQSDPKEIRKVFDMSKASYKRAIGRLYRDQKIEITPEGIRLLKK